MKVSSVLSFIAAVLPTLLVQHATPANAAALCIPGIYCPATSSSPVPECTVGGTPPQSSSPSTHTDTSTWVPKTSTPSDPTPTETYLPPTTTYVPEPPSTTIPAVPVSSPSDTSPVYPSDPAGSSPGGGQYTATTTVTVSGAPQPTGSSCSTGPVQCCNSVQPSSSEDASELFGLLGIVLQGVNLPVGIDCVPIDVLGIGSGGTCNAQTVCCENNNFNGLINLGCSPINIGL